MFRIPNLLMLSDGGKDDEDLCKILHNHAVVIQAKGIHAIRSQLRRAAVDVVFCSWRSYSKYWSAIQDEVQSQHPDLPVIVVSSNGDEREWIEVLESGAFDLLAWPSPKPTVLAAVEQAVASHEGRRLHGFAPTVDSASLVS